MENHPYTQDVLSYAAQLGRLDLVSLLLTVLGLILSLGSFFAYLNLRSLARHVACKEATKKAKETAKEVANEYFQTELPRLLKEHPYFFSPDNATSDDANSIAQAQEKTVQEKQERRGV